MHFSHSGSPLTVENTHLSPTLPSILWPLQDLGLQAMEGYRWQTH